jgi:glycosyltransferase involved in cell wall biosynthesis
VNLYVTQDKIGTPTGGGAVTYHEYLALSTMGEETHPVDSGRVQVSQDPFLSDRAFCAFLGGIPAPRLTAMYSGCMTETVRMLRSKGTKVSYTAAAHSISESRKEFEMLGASFPYPHLTEPHLWEKYVGGYKEADLVICPSTVSKRCMESYGCKNVVVVPHGCEIPREIVSLPKRFTVGYLGQAGPDKGLRYLFEAWKKLNLKDSTLIVAGNNIDQALPLWRRFGGGNVEFTGFVKTVDQFYNRISLYVQPSVTEGFGIEILEAMAHSRAVIASIGAGASELLTAASMFQPRNPDQIADLIESYRANHLKLVNDAAFYRNVSKDYSWEKIRSTYQNVWRSM